MTEHQSESQRFEFGENWSRFLEVLNDTRIQNAEQSLKQMLKVSTLRGLTFLDIGSGSGLFSLAAWRLGARVHSFDYDVRSVACTSELKRQFCSNDLAWTIEQGDVLNEAYVRSLGYISRFITIRGDRLDIGRLSSACTIACLRG